MIPYFPLWTFQRLIAPEAVLCGDTPPWSSPEAALCGDTLPSSQAATKNGGV